MRRIVVLLYMPIGLILSTPYLLFTYIVSFFNRKLTRKLAYGFTRSFSVGLMWLSGAKFHIHGMEHIDESNNYLVVANHTSLLDTPVLMILLKEPLSFISKMEMKKVPILSQWMSLLHCLFLNRSSNREGLKTILKGIENLKKGDHLAIFPQGTRSTEDNYLPMKAGSFKLATKSEKQILPIAIYGTANILENNNFNIRSSDVHVHIFPPIPTATMSRESQKTLPDEISSLIENQYKAFKSASSEA